MDPLPGDIAQRMKAVKRQNQVFSEILSTYVRALRLFTEGVRVTLLDLGMSELDILKNIDRAMGETRDFSAALLKQAEAQKAQMRPVANSAGEETRQ